MARNYGKADSGVMDVVYKHLGQPNSDVISGPKRGLDNAFIKLAGGKTLVVSTDPVSIVPQIGVRKSAWLSAHLIASDVATSGVPPKFASFSLNLPETLASSEEAEYVSALGDACEELGVAVVSGHTGTYPGAGFTVVGGGTMFALADDGAFVSPTMANVGDRVLMTKGAAIEAAASLSWAFRSATERRVGKRLAARGRALIDQCTVVNDASAASAVGLGPEGVTSMHDATEGGVLGALDEMSDASMKRFEIRADRIMVSEEAKAVCGAFGIDPLTSLSEGTLLLTCSPKRVEDVEHGLTSSGVAVADIGVVRKGRGVWLGRGGRPPDRFKPRPDGYWRAYNEGLRALTE
ncbi:MAG: AIR synthase [Thaumarchaeota archaeon]|nr:AIR synthase [Nitrososphaerota archaeon]